MKHWIWIFIFVPLYAKEISMPYVRPSKWGQPVVSRSVNNWYQIDEKVYRSSQPDSEGMGEILEFGIKNILCLRNYHDDEKEARNLDLKLFAVKMKADEISDDEVIKALKIIKESKDPILVHCWHGSDRTGCIIAMYRILFHNWSKEAAIQEMRYGGYGFHEQFDNIIEYIQSVDIESLKKAL